MRKVIVSEFISLDGKFDGYACTASHWKDEIAAFKHKYLIGSGALVLGGNY